MNVKKTDYLVTFRLPSYSRDKLTWRTFLRGEADAFAKLVGADLIERVVRTTSEYETHEVVYQA